MLPAAVYRNLRLFYPGGMDTRRYLVEMERNQWLPQEALQALQLARLQKLVKHAYENAPFYRERYSAAGFEPGDFKTLKDFEALPFLTKEDIRHNRDRIIAQNFPKEKLVPNETGGSTGQPMHFYIDDSFWWWNQANHLRVRRWHGVGEGDRVAWLWGAKRDMPEESLGKRLKTYMMNERYLNAFNMTEQKMRDFAEMLVRWQPAVIYGYASVLSLFARFIQENKITGIRPRLVDSTSEKLSGPQRELLQEVFQCKIIDDYSSRELGIMACECETGEFLVTSDVRYLEIVANGQVVPTGEMGEVAITSTYQFSWPFIRYKNGDMAIYEAETSRSGRAFPVLKEVVGRTNDFLVTSEGKFVHSEFFAYTFRIKPEVVRYQIYQSDRQRLDIRLVCNQPVSESWLAAAKGEVQDRFGPATDITIRVVEDIPLTPAGKHRFIVSDITPDFVS